MATHVAKKMKVDHEPVGSSANGDAAMKPEETNLSDDEEDSDDETGTSAIAQFQSEDGTNVGPQLEIPMSSNVRQMEELVNELLQNGKNRVPYSLFIGETEVTTSLKATVEELKLSTETALTITFQPLAAFRVRPVTRCSDTLQGHSEAILHVSFSPDGKRLASGGGDATVRFWDTNTCMPKHTGRGHKNHVLCTAWSPDGTRFASADRNGEIRLWDPLTGKQIGQPMKGHKQWVTSLTWEPMHRNATCERFASSSKDGSIKVWNARTGRSIASLSGHTDSVECIKWGGEGLMYSASRDRTIKVWAMEGEHVGKLVRTLIGHGHRINTLALNVDYVCRSGPFGHKTKSFASREEMQYAALKRYQEVRKGQPERLVSGSDDFTLFFWEPSESKKPLARLTGHQQPVNHLSFSPDGRYFASASFDKKVKIWNGQTGKFVATLTGHVGAVYQVCWSSDARLIVTASKDSTVKVWELSEPKNAKTTLSGHADEVYALDWSPNGDMVASGSKDRTIKIWKH
ncbi:Notchless 1 [Phytophthora cactorum]|uniref:Notchless 1 n=1 Tax=Phytophthora cactorum TaxID=29920 RepID=A0A329SDQ6_9STRA|nr:Notchless 1 [Phytophthora cactorum]KAG2835122.1 Notchless 1 [Phytophthora cactorum]KAG2842742.1 Notchless 1 [Phytophthora cactorum]KAG2862433.1 Notchless 1 [Phytophthora cactorum]KAG2919203.1 Notchless 1 [Phytophthora cactorum]